MKILHVADIHYRCDLLEEINKCIDFLIRTVREVTPDVVVLAGDLFDERQSHDSPAFLSALEFIETLGRYSHVFMVKGTPSHDGHTLKFFQTRRVYVSEVPEQVLLTSRGFVTPRNDRFFVEGIREGVVLFSSLPSVPKSRIMERTEDLFTGTLTIADLMRDVLRSFGEVNGRVDIPRVLAGHLTVIGSVLSGGQQMVGRDVELGVEDLRMAVADLVLLGHIHKAQRWGEIFYSGSITRLNFGEEEDKGFWLHFLEDGRWTSEFITTPARRMVTLDFEGMPSIDEVELPEDAYVRIRYSVDEEEVHCVDEKALEERLLSSGAVEVKVEKTVVPKQRVRAEGISGLLSLEDKLRKWAEITGTELPGGVFDKLVLLEDEKDEFGNRTSGMEIFRA